MISKKLIKLFFNTGGSRTTLPPAHGTGALPLSYSVKKEFVLNSLK